MKGDKSPKSEKSLSKGGKSPKSEKSPKRKQSRSPNPKKN